MKKLTSQDIGYRGKAIDALTHDELLAAFLELAQAVHDCASKETTCKNILKIETA